MTRVIGFKQQVRGLWNGQSFYIHRLQTSSSFSLAFWKPTRKPREPLRRYRSGCALRNASPPPPWVQEPPVRPGANSMPASWINHRVISWGSSISIMSTHSHTFPCISKKPTDWPSTPHHEFANGQPTLIAFALAIDSFPHE